MRLAEVSVVARMNVSNPIRHLYVHIPFCPQLCDYCAFYSEKLRPGIVDRFIQCLLREIQLVSEKYNLQPHTLFFGGGTPSALSVSQFATLFEGMHKILNFNDLQEFTVEMNPATVSREKATLLKQQGVNRISMGVQGFDDQTLKMLNRVHNAAQIQKSYDILREVGFDNVNLDLMFGLPTQTAEHWVWTLNQAMALKPDHLSCYCLTYEEDTVFWQKRAKGEYVPSEKLEVELFEHTWDLTSGAGYQCYEISNYALPGRECLHNLAYWEGCDFAAFGPSACGTLGSLRFQNISNTDEYCRRIENNESLLEFSEFLDSSLRLKEQLMFGMRTQRGVDRALVAPWDAELQPFVEARLIESSGDRIRLTRAGRLMADEVAMVFV